MPEVNTSAMQTFLDEFSKTIGPDEHVALFIDQAGWHCANDLKMPDTITFVPLPPYSPELNPVERIWEYLKERYLSHRLLNDYDAIEDDFKVPMFGNRRLLRIEERDQHPNQYDLLDAATIRHPLLFPSHKDIDRPVLVKVLEAARGFERAFFIARSPEHFEAVAEARLAVAQAAGASAAVSAG